MSFLLKEGLMLMENNKINKQPLCDSSVAALVSL